MSKCVIAIATAVLLLAAGVAPERIAVIYGSYDPDRFHPGVDGGAVRRV